jgi:hypothetical protein
MLGGKRYLYDEKTEDMYERKESPDGPLRGKRLGKLSPPPRTKENPARIITDAEFAAAMRAAKSATDAAEREGKADRFTKMLLGGKHYWVNLSNGHTYVRTIGDESLGRWAGIFSRTPQPNIDASVPAPPRPTEDPS